MRLNRYIEKKKYIVESWNKNYARPKFQLMRIDILWLSYKIFPRNTGMFCCCSVEIFILVNAPRRSCQRKLGTEYTDRLSVFFYV